MNANKRLKEIRKTFRLTQKEFADKLDLENYQIGDMERGKQKLSSELANKIEDIFGISGWWLLTGKGDMFLDKNKQQISIIGNNHRHIINSGNITISINKNDISSGDEEDIKMLCSLIKYAPKPFIKNIIEKLEKFKEISEI